MSAHFCMGEFAGISIGEKQQEQCGYCGMDDAGCCHDLLQIVKLDNTQLEKASSISLDYKFTPPPTSNFTVIQAYTRPNYELKSLFDTSLGDPPIFLRNCVFRI